MKRDRLALELTRARRPVAWLALLFALAAVAAAAMLARQQFVSPLGDYYRVDVPLDHAAGVRASKTELRIAGVRVGLVEDVRLVDGRPRATLALAAEHGPLYRDATARLAAITPLQDMYVELERGTPRAGAIPDRGALAGQRSSAAVAIADVLDSFEADERIRLGRLLRELGRGLPDGGVRLRSTFAQLAPLMRSATAVARALGAQRRELARAVHNSARITGVLARRDRRLAALVRDGQRTLGVLARRDAPLRATLDELPATVAALETGLGRVERAVAAVDPALRRLRPVARELPAGLTALRRFAGDATPALRALEPAARELAPLTGTLRRSAGALERASAVLRPQVPALDDFTRVTVDCLGPLRRFVHRFVSANRLGSAKGTWWRNQLVLGGDTLGGADAAVRPIDACSDGGGAG